MLKSKKKTGIRKLTGIALLAVSAAGIGGTGAVIQHRLELKNALKTPTVVVDIHDYVGTNGYPDSQVKDGKKTKEVSFANKGSADVFIRVAYAEQWNSGEELLSSKNSRGSDIVPKLKKKSGSQMPESGSMENMFDKEDWYCGNDGWYYYRHVLPEGGSTDNIITAVDFSELRLGEGEQGEGNTLEAKYRSADYDLHFQVEAVQASDDYVLDQEVVEEVFGAGLGKEPETWDTDKYGVQLTWTDGADSKERGSGTPEPEGGN